MPGTLHRISPLRICKLTGAKLYSIGRRLYLRALSPTAKSWVFRYPLNGSFYKMSIGSADSIALVETVNLAHACRKLEAKVRVSIHKPKIGSERAAARHNAQDSNRGVLSELYVGTHSSVAKPETPHPTRIYPRDYSVAIIGDMPVCDIVIQRVHRLLAKVWNEKTKTA